MMSFLYILSFVLSPDYDKPLKTKKNKNPMSLLFEVIKFLRKLEKPDGTKTGDAKKT